MMPREKAKNYVDALLTALKSGAVRVKPTGELQGDALNWGFVTSRHEIEADILRRDPLATAEVQRFRDAMSGKQAAPVKEPPPVAKPAEQTPEQRAQANIRRELHLLDLRLKGVID